MRMEIIAEGVETFDQVTYLRERGIGAAQGYVFAPPLPAATFLQLLEAMDRLAKAAGQAGATGARGDRAPADRGNLTETRRVIAALQGLGVKVAIDDVGTGHSGLSYMLKLGVDIIKIDKMFIDSLGTDRNSNTIIETLIDLAQNMRMDVIAEGVESFEQVLHLRDLGIRAAQGFVFSPPLPCSAFLQLVETIDPLKAGAPAADQPTAMLAALAQARRGLSGKAGIGQSASEL